MIRAPSGRTRALYKWERDVLDSLPQARRLSPTKLVNFCMDVWHGEGWDAHEACPVIFVRRMNELTYTHGRGVICFKPHDVHVVTALHELAHARGYGAGRDTHSVSFLLTYFRLLHVYAGIEYMWLVWEAKVRGLL